MKDIIECDDSIFKAPVTSTLLSMTSVIDNNYKSYLKCTLNKPDSYSPPGCLQLIKSLLIASKQYSLLYFSPGKS